MSAGDVTNPKRVRVSANQRVDAVDVDALSTELLEHNDAQARAELFTPLNVGGTSPTGMILTGYSLTLNPTGGSDGKVRINPALGVAVDADGRLIVKENGTQIDVSIPSGTNQLYIYWNETAVDAATRRFISVTSPFSESPKTTNTRFQSTFGTWVRSGNATTIVATDNVNGQTKALVCIGIVTNTAGVISVTGYDTTLAPNGTTITNRLSTITQPTTVPANNSTSGTFQTLHDLVKSLGYLLGRAIYNSSTFLTPSAANNFGAYSQPVIGVDRAGREIYDTVTIGDGVSVFGSYNRNQFATDDQMLNAALATLATRATSGLAVGYLLIKPGVTLSTFTGNVTVPTNCRVVIQGSGDLSASPQIIINSAVGFTLASTTTSFLAFENISISNIGTAVLHSITTTFRAKRCIFTRNGSAAVLPLFTTNTAVTTISDCIFDRCTFIESGINAYDDTKYMFIDTGTNNTQGVPTRFVLSRCIFTNTTNFSQRGIRVGNINEGLNIDDCKFQCTQTGAAAPVNITPFWVELISQSGTFASGMDRRIRGCIFNACGDWNSKPIMCGISLTDVCGLTISHCDFQRILRPVNIPLGTQGGSQDVKILGCRFLQRANGITIQTNTSTSGGGVATGPLNHIAAINTTSTLKNFTVQDCYFEAWVCYHADSSVSTSINVTYRGCTFIDSMLLFGDPFSPVSSFQTVDVNHCTFQRTSSSITAFIPVRIHGPTLKQISVSSCFFRGYAFASTNVTPLCIDLGSGSLVTTLDQIHIDGCSFADCDNETMNYLGSSTTTLHSLIFLYATTLMVDITVTRCRASTIMSSAVRGTASNLQHVTFVGSSSSNVGPTTVQNMQISNNVIGDISSHCGLVNTFGLSKFVFNSLLISDNQHTIKMNDDIVTGAGYDDQWSGTYLNIPSSSTEISGELSVSGNVYYIVNTNGGSGLGSPIYKMIYHRDDSVSATSSQWGSVLIANNVLTVDINASSINAVNFIGLVGGLTFVNNIARRKDLRTGTANVAFTKFFSGVSSAVPAKPGAGVTWTNNNCWVDQ